MFESEIAHKVIMAFGVATILYMLTCLGFLLFDKQEIPAGNSDS